MRIEERYDGGLVILDLKGNLRLGDGDELLREMVNSLLADGKTTITLNFADVPYIDSAGLGEIVRCYTPSLERTGSSSS
jgi:anti-anti-sigma factor